jgi:pimeloyl-ACP methyl ester carboxylesterase
VGAAGLVVLSSPVNIGSPTRRKRMKIRGWLAFSGLLVSLACTENRPDAPFHTAVAPAPAPGSMFLYPERVPLQGGGFVEAERGFFFAPVNRSNPESGVLGIEVYRFKGSNQAEPSTPPIFFLHGGPSFQGLQDALEVPGTFEDRWLPLTRVSDVVVVGQRGIGSSKPTTSIEVSTTPQAVDQPFDAEGAATAFREILAEQRAFWEASGLDLSGFTVLEMAEDVNDVRKALGYDRITLWGGSFGSHWGMTLMRAHPEIVERAILRGMEGPDHTYDHPGHLWNVYRRVAEEAEATPDLRDRVPEGGLVAAFEGMVARASAEPFTVPFSDPRTGERHDVLIDGSSMQMLARGFSSGLEGWPADVIEMAEGDFSRAAEALFYRRGEGGREIRTASYFQLDCGSGITQSRLSEQISDPANQILFGMNWGYIEGCPAWESDLGDGFRENFDTDIPTVIVHGTWDTSTPYENALELVPHFKDSKFIPVIRGPHGSIQAAMAVSEAFRDGVLHFAATGDRGFLPDTVWMPEPTFRVPGGE